MNAPKRLWHPVLFEVDEAHKFCPEKGEGESEAKEGMLSLASDGRKYGFCAIFATQRLSKLDKSAASELTNVLVGPTFLDIDLQRAHKALGIIPKDQAAFNEQMKTIAPGHFWALGRAISKQRVLVTVGAIQTTHPTAGSGKYSAEPPPAPDKIKALLPKLADLPQEAETKARTEAEFKREIRELKQKLTAASRQSSVASTESRVASKSVADPRAIELATARAVAAAVKARDVEWAKTTRGLKDQLSGIRSHVGRALRSLPIVASALDDVEKAFAQEVTMPAAPAPGMAPLPGHAPGALTAMASHTSHISHTSHTTPAAPRPPRTETMDPMAAGELGKLALKVAGILAGYYPQALKRNVVAAMCGVVDGGNFSNRLSELRTAGLLEDPGRGLIKGTELCAKQYAGTFDPPTNTEEVVELWNARLGALAQKILRHLVDAQGTPLSRADVAAATGVVDGGNFSNRLSELRTAGLIVDPGRGMIAANKETLFLEEVAA